MTAYQKRQERLKYNNIVAFDLETIPDVELIKSEFPELKDLEDEKKIISYALDSWEEKKGVRFLPPIFHKIISIGLCSYDINGGFKFNVGYVGDSKKNSTEVVTEDEILRTWDVILSKKPTIVSFNGSGFDLPVIIMRSAKILVPQSHLMDKSNKFENYLYQYSDMHIDLYFEYGGRGSASGLDLMSRQLVNESKPEGVNGADVYKLFYEDQKDIIKKYVATDVFLTMALFGKLAIVEGSRAGVNFGAAVNTHLKPVYDKYIEQLNV